jgi:hypothetical protein
MKALLLLLAVSGCGSAPASSVPKYSTDHDTNQDAESLVSEFELAWGHQVKTPVFVVQPQDLAQHKPPEHTVALCIEDVHGKYVLVDSDFWAKADVYERTATVFHELGHCALNRLHSEAQTEDGRCPLSLMYPSINWPAACLETGSRTLTEYEQELFGRK